MSLQGAYEHEEGVKQRWIVVFSEKAFARETKTLEKKIKKENREGNVEKGEVATNELDSEKLSDEEVLKAYKCVAEPNITSPSPDSYPASASSLVQVHQVVQ